MRYPKLTPGNDHDPVSRKMYMASTRHFYPVDCMAYKERRLVALFLASGFFIMASLPGIAQLQQANLSDIGGATVTLYYYDRGNATMGAIVPMDDNPQAVSYDPAISAPGMYAFSHVPAGQWYYLEAEHKGKKWYAIFYMDEGAGTKTANVNIPPLAPVNETAGISPSPSPAPTAVPTSAPIPTTARTPPPTPGMAFTAAIIALVITISLLARRL